MFFFISRIPDIAMFEWHPFTISSAPEGKTIYKRDCKLNLNLLFSQWIKFEPRLKYGWFHLKLYSMFQDLSRRSIKPGFWRIWDAAQINYIRSLDLYLYNNKENAKTHNYWTPTILYCTLLYTLQPVSVSLLYFKLCLFDLTEIISKVHDTRLKS